MTPQTYHQLETYMYSCMPDSAHDKDHIYRVLYLALDIAEKEMLEKGMPEKEIDMDVLIAACLLHDIGRVEQFENPALCHAQVGSQKAYDYLLKTGWEEEKAAHVRDCILTHRFRADNPPASAEARILFDADKLDVTGTIGIARTIMYKVRVGEPLYTLLPDGEVADGSGKEPPSFFTEYQYKLKNVYDKFYTKRAEEIAAQRQPAAAAFYEAMYEEVKNTYRNGQAFLQKNVSFRKS